MSSQLQEVTDISFRDTSQVGIEPILNRDYISSEYQFDTRPFTGRYFYITTMKWAKTDPRYAVLSPLPYLPNDIFTASTALINLVKQAAFYRMKLVLSLSVGGTISHGGCLLVSVTPPSSQEFRAGPNIVNTAMTCPHGFLYACEATSLEVSVPWYCNVDYAPVPFYESNKNGACDFNQTYATLVVMVMNPLVDGGGSDTLNIVISAKFEELELRVPAPRTLKWVSETIVGDAAKGLTALAKAGTKVFHTVGDIFDKVSSISSMFTGLHNPNVPVIQERVIASSVNYLNTVDTQQFFEKLDPYPSAERVTDEFIFGTTQDEMSLRYIAAKEQYLGTINIASSDIVGKVLWTRPISPFQTPGYALANNLSLLYMLSRAWNGDFEIVLRGAGTAKQQVKLMINRLYAPGVGCMTSYPDMEDTANSLSQVVEFAQGGQEHVILMPYLSSMEVTPCTTDQFSSSLLVGEYVIYIAQPLVVGDGAPLTMEVNVFIRSKTLNFYGYATESPWLAVVVKDADKPKPVQNDTVFETVKPLETERKHRHRSSSKTRYDFITTDYRVPMFRSESGLEFLNTPQRQEGNVVDEGHKGVVSRIHRIDSLRDFIRRMYYFGTFTAVAKETTIPLATFLGGENPNQWGFTYSFNPLVLLGSMYYGRQVGFKLRLNFVGAGKINSMKVYYFPPKPVHYTLGTKTLMYDSLPLTYLDVTKFPAPLIDVQALTYNTASNTSTAEFVIPNATLTKFVSVNLKGKPFQDSERYYIQSHGSIVIYCDSETLPAIEIYCGLTDESRLGFQCMAPIVYLGIADESDPNIYRLYSKYGDKDAKTNILRETSANYKTQGYLPNFDQKG